MSKKIEADELSDIDEDELTEMTKKVEKNIQEPTIDFKERVVMYVSLDDAIRQKQEEIKELKEKKKPCEEFIIRYLEKAKGDTVNITNGKLVKNEIERKTPISMEIVSASLKEEIIQKNILSDTTKCENFITEIMDAMEKKRTVKKTTNIKRMFVKENAKSKTKTK